MQDGRGSDSFIFPSTAELERTDSFIFSRVYRATMDELIAARRRTFTRWMNLKLKGSKLHVDDLEKDMSTGVVLIRLLQILSPRKKVVQK